jgi:hypothetical protein
VGLFIVILLVVLLPGLLIAALAWSRGTPWYVWLGWFVLAEMSAVLAMAAGIQGCRRCNDPLVAAVEGLTINRSWGLLGPLWVPIIYLVTRLIAWATRRWGDSRGAAAPHRNRR